jgi:hypothetical protein
MTSKVTATKTKRVGRPKGSTNKINGEKILLAVAQQCGKPFEQLIAEGYHAAILACDMTARIAYEKMLLAKVVADKHEIDHTTLGQSLNPTYVFKQKELPEWDNLPKLTTIEK